MTDIRCPNCQKKVAESRNDGHAYLEFRCDRCKRRFAVMLYNGQMDSKVLDKATSLV